ncbi:Sel1-repeat containing protein [Gracilaria domingensis]|nr:Sel1-repeat containing protein [Gracilaria domingensis]
MEGVSSAQSALGWVYRWGAGGSLKNVSAAMREWEKAVAASGDPEACNGLGLLYHHGRNDIAVDGERARHYYQIAVDQGYPPAAVNLGVMLHDGAAGLEPDGVAARGLYEIASRHGDAIAANNLGLLLRHGAPGVEIDAPAAVRAYELAIERQERHHACRNLAELLWEGAPGVPPSRANAVEYFGMAISRGDAGSRKAACGSLRQLLQTSLKNREHISNALIDKCGRLLGERRRD